MFLFCKHYGVVHRVLPPPSTLDMLNTCSIFYTFIHTYSIANQVHY